LRDAASDGGERQGNGGAGDPGLPDGLPAACLAADQPGEGNGRSGSEVKLQDEILAPGDRRLPAERRRFARRAGGRTRRSPRRQRSTIRDPRAAGGRSGIRRELSAKGGDSGRRFAPCRFRWRRAPGERRCRRPRSARWPSGCLFGGRSARRGQRPERQRGKAPRRNPGARAKSRRAAIRRSMPTAAP
jgi:hypothetical protein